jgi:hypothetical protein
VSSYVTLFKCKISKLDIGDLNFSVVTGVGFSGVKLGYSFQHSKYSQIELSSGTRVYVSIYTTRKKNPIHGIQF